MDPLGGWLAAGRVGGDDEGFVTGSAEMLDHPKHRVADAVDIREERLCDDRNAHTKIVSSVAFRKVAARDTTRKNLVRPAGATVLACGPPGPWRCVTAGLLITAVGCSRTVDGTAQPDPRKPGVALSGDGYGIVAGFDDAPVNVEIFTEPQCNHCADLQADFGDDIARYLNIGQLAVTYRPMTFLDDSDDRYSARVSNALFLAVDPRRLRRRFRRSSRSSMRSSGRSPTAPVTTRSPTWHVIPIYPPRWSTASRADEPALDVVDMANTNFGLPV